MSLRIKVLCHFAFVCLPITLSLLLQEGDGDWLRTNYLSLVAYLVSSAAATIVGGYLQAKLREGTAGLVQFAYGGGVLIWWLGSALILISGIQFGARITVLGNLIASLISFLAWSAGHFCGIKVEALSETRGAGAKAKREAVLLCGTVEQTALLNSAIPAAIQQSIRLLCNRISSLGTSSFRQFSEPFLLSRLLGEFHRSLSVEGVTEASLSAQIAGMNQEISQAGAVRRGQATANHTNDLSSVE